VSTVEFDLTALVAFGRDLSKAGDGLLGKVRPVVSKGALSVKNAMRDDMSKSAHFGQVARSITYDTRSGASWAEAEAGPVTEGRTVGDLAHLAYFGGAHGGGGTVRDPQDALDDEAPKFFKAIEDVIGGLP
jgi:hypothetical protein